MINKEDTINKGINIIDNVPFDLLRLTLVSTPLNEQKHVHRAEPR